MNKIESSGYDYHLYFSKELYLTDLKKDLHKKKKAPLLNDLVSEESLLKNYRILGKVNHNQSVDR